jgi:hypothetical protein
LALAAVGDRYDTTASLLHHVARATRGKANYRQTVGPGFYDDCWAGVAQARDRNA